MFTSGEACWWSSAALWMLQAVKSKVRLCLQSLTSHTLLVRWGGRVCVCVCVSFCPPIYPSIRGLDKVHVSLSPGLSGLSHKTPLPRRLMAVLISHLEPANRRRWTDLSHTPREKTSTFVFEGFVVCPPAFVKHGEVSDTFQSLL